MDMEIGNLIEDLVFYAQNEMQLGKEDSVYAKNQLLELFGCEIGNRNGKLVDLSQNILLPLTQYALEKEMIQLGEELRFETKLMGLVTPSAGLVVKNFAELYKSDPLTATDYLYKISVAAQYIRLSDIRKNIGWHAVGNRGKIGITINLSKPEKDNKQVAAERNVSSIKYPKCLLCLENIGFHGTATHPARQTIRIVPLRLNGEEWHMQFSPYMYYDEHVIAFADEHRPMAVTEKTFVRLTDFVDIFPHYFIGSNADLPIVGGSILTHDHYQGGKKVLPMFRSPIITTFLCQVGLTVGIRDWYNSVVTVRGENKDKVLDACNRILGTWKTYSDTENGILAYTNNTPHNTITPIATKENGIYCVDLILRNNRTDDTHPDGIFHPTADMHAIKKEGIGLIEAMGLFILPGRLKKEITAVIKVLLADKIDFDAIADDPDIGKHLEMIARIDASIDMQPDPDTVQQMVMNEINQTCLKILDCTAVFKHTEQGNEGFIRFLNRVFH